MAFFNFSSGTSCGVTNIMFPEEKPSMSPIPHRSKLMRFKGLMNLEVQKGLSLQLIHTCLIRETTLFRFPKTLKDQYVIDFLPNQVQLSKEFVMFTYNRHKPEKPTMISSNMLRKVRLGRLKGNSVGMSIIISENWLLENVVEDYEHLYSCFKQKKSLTMDIHSDYVFKRLIHQIDVFKETKLGLMVKVIQLIEHFCNIMATTKKDSDQILGKTIFSGDKEKLLSVGKKLEKHPEHKTRIVDLALSCDMSLSKFKRLFYQIYGISPYRYQFQKKMEKSMKMLTKGNYSVSEVGYSVGYNNLSQFSKAFKKYFGVLPSQVIK